MSRLSLPAPAKLNLTLRVAGRRADGMHLLNGTMVLIDLQDTVILSARQDGKITSAWQHPLVPAKKDITVQAARMLQAAANRSSLGVDIAVTKRIPIGGGLGGGSSDAATVLIGLNQLWRLNWSAHQLLPIASRLGADVAFFLYGQGAKIKGIGDVFSKIKTKINSYLLVFPPIVSLTANVYSEYARLTNLKKIDRIPPLLKKSSNDLAVAAFNLYPPIKQVARALYDTAGEANLSGSGSTLYAVFADDTKARQAQRALPAGIRSAVVRSIAEHPLRTMYPHYWGVAKW